MDHPDLTVSIFIEKSIALQRVGQTLCYCFRYAAESTETIHLDIQCGEEGSFYVTFVPKRAGMHNLAIKWQNHHVEGSPFRIKVRSRV